VGLEAFVRERILILLFLFAPLYFVGAQTFVCSVESPDPSLGVFLGTVDARYYYMGILGGRGLPSYARLELGGYFFTQRNWQERLQVWISTNRLSSAPRYPSWGTTVGAGKVINTNALGSFNISNPTARFLMYTAGAVLLTEKKLHFAPWPNGIDRYESKMYLTKNRALFAPYIKLQPNSYFQGSRPFDVYGANQYNPASDVIFETVIYYIGQRAVSTNVRILDPAFSAYSGTNSWYAINVDVR
jgi:hypothetical protein